MAKVSNAPVTEFGTTSTGHDSDSAYASCGNYYQWDYHQEYDSHPTQYDFHPNEYDPHPTQHDFHPNQYVDYFPDPTLVCAHQGEHDGLAPHVQYYPAIQSAPLEDFAAWCANQAAEFRRTRYWEEVAGKSLGNKLHDCEEGDWSGPPASRYSVFNEDAPEFPRESGDPVLPAATDSGDYDHLLEEEGGQWQEPWWGLDEIWARALEEKRTRGAV